MEWDIQNMKVEHKLRKLIIIFSIILALLAFMGGYAFFYPFSFYGLSGALVLSLLFSSVLLVTMKTKSRKVFSYIFISGFFISLFILDEALIFIFFSIYVLLIFSSWISLNFSDWGENKKKFIEIYFLTFLTALVLLAFIITALDPYSTFSDCILHLSHFFILPVLIVPTIIYFAYDKVVQKEPKEEPIKPKEREKPLMKPCPLCGEKILVNSKFCSHCGKSLIPSGKLGKLLEKKTELKRQIEDLKEEKDSLISKKILSKKEYQKKYEEIMDQLVDIEDKIIREKMKRGAKK